MKSPSTRAPLMYILAMTVYGSIGVFRRFIPLSSSALAFVRGLIGGVFMLAFTKLRGGTVFGGISKKTALLLMLAGGMIGLNWMLLFEAYNHTTVAVATLCYYMQPTLLILLSPLVFKEALTLKKGVCATAAVLGMTLVSGVLGGEPLGSSAGLGILFGLGAAALYTVIVILNKKLAVENAYGQTTIELLSAAVVMIPYLLLTETAFPFPTDATALCLIAVVGVVHTGIAYAMYFGSIGRLSSQTVAVLGYIDPVVALCLSVVVLHEPMAPLQAIGAVMILTATLVSELRITRHTNG